MADLNVKYAASSNLTITLASLATDANLLTGRESTAIDNTTNLYVDALIGGMITVGTSPTANTQIEVWAYGARNDTPDYPDVFDGTDSAETVTSAGIKSVALHLLKVLRVDATTSDRSYYFGPIAIAPFFGGVLPTHYGVFVTHNTGVNLNATAGNHEISHTGIEGSTA